MRLIRLIRCQVNGLILKSNRCDLHFCVQRMDVFYSTAASEKTIFRLIPLKLCGTLICIQLSAVYHRFVLLFTPFVNPNIQAYWLVCPQVHCAELEVIRIWTLHRIYKTFGSSSSSAAAVRPRRRGSGRRRRLRDPTTAAHVGVCGGGHRRCSGRPWWRFHRRRRRDFAAGARVRPLPGPGWRMPSGTATFCRTFNTLAIQYLCADAFQSQFCSRVESTISFERYIPGIYPVYNGISYDRYIPGKWQVCDKWYIPGIYLSYDNVCHMTGIYQVYSRYILYIVICRVYTRYIPSL